MSSISRDLRNKIINFLISLPNIGDNDQQRTLILNAGLDSQLQNQISFDKPPIMFFSLFVATSLSYGRLRDGCHPLEAVLVASKNYVGQDKQNHCDNLIQKLKTELQAIEVQRPKPLNSRESIGKPLSDESKTRLDYCENLRDLYEIVKSVRRTLRAEGLTTKYHRPPDVITKEQLHCYVEELRRINDVQLGLEWLKEKAQNSSAFAEFVNLSEKLKNMEDYLRKLLKEYEKTKPLLNAGEKVPFSTLQRLVEFTGSTKADLANTDYRFRSHFADPFHTIVKWLEGPK